MIASFKKLIKYFISSPEFIGSYSSFEDIESYDDYDNNIVAKKYVNENLSNVLLKKNTSFSPGLSIIQNYLLDEKKQIKILDFGGGIGTVHKFLFSQNLFF